MPGYANVSGKTCGAVVDRRGGRWAGGNRSGAGIAWPGWFGKRPAHTCVAHVRLVQGIRTSGRGGRDSGSGRPVAGRGLWRPFPARFYHSRLRDPDRFLPICPTGATFRPGWSGFVGSQPRLVKTGVLRSPLRHPRACPLDSKKRGRDLSRPSAPVGGSGIRGQCQNCVSTPD
jgi:hypothetical protein